MRKTIFFLIILSFSIFVLQDLASAGSAEAPQTKQRNLNISTTPSDITRLSLDNLLGKDTSIKGSGRLMEDSRYIKAGFEKRHIFDSPYFIGVDGTGRSWHTTEFYLSGGGGDLYAGRYITKLTKATLNYRFDRYDISNTDSISAVDFRRHDGTHDTAALSLNLERSALDDVFYPTKGTTLAFIAEYALKGIGGDFDFFKYETNGAYFFTPFWNITFGAHARIGYMEDFRKSADVPFFERYFVGSSNTVRGFKWGKAGSVSSQDNPLGNDVMIAGNLEARFPIYRKLKGVVFFDTGKGFDKISKIGHTDLRESAGLGLRYLTPWMVLRADYGFVLDRKSGESGGRLHLNLGLPF